MAYEHKEGFGSLFKNKKPGEGRPDLTGSFKMPVGAEAGDVLDIAAWTVRDEGGEFRRFNIKISEPYLGRSTPKPSSDDFPF